MPISAHIPGATRIPDGRVPAGTPAPNRLSATPNYRRIAVAALAAMALAAIGAGAWFAWHADQPAVGTGSGINIIPQGSMSDEEAQGLADAATEASRIDVSIAAVLQLSGDGRLRLDFSVPEPNNGLSERLEVEQDGRVVCSAGPLAPGGALEWAAASGAREGSATVTVHAVGPDGIDLGNPVAVEVQIAH